VTQLDLWSLDSIGSGHAVFKNFDGCVEASSSCPNSLSSEQDNFTSSAAWYQSFTKEVGISLGMSWSGLSVSVSASMNQEDYYFWFNKKYSTYAASRNSSSCFVVSEACNVYDQLSDDLVGSLQVSAIEQTIKQTTFRV
jgi:hypothetical protein